MTTAAQTKPRRLTRKQVEKVIAEYDLPGKVRAHLETLGELVWHRPEQTALARRGAVGYWCAARLREIVVLTKAGPLGISIYDDEILCIFDDPELAKRYVGASLNGKWNHHAFVGYCHAPTSREDMIKDLDMMLRGFKSSLGLLTTEGT